MIEKDHQQTQPNLNWSNQSTARFN